MIPMMMMLMKQMMKVRRKNEVEESMDSVVVGDYLMVTTDIYCSYSRRNVVDQQILSYNSSRVLIRDYLMKMLP
jgi:hypothetical protein